MPTRIKIIKVEKVTHNVRRYTLERPEGFDFEPGQATELSIDRDGWRDRKRPFTFTGLADAENLEFTIKSYFDHDGVTKQLWELEPGDGLLLREPWGTITYKGRGTFIAGGAGVTPFIAILRALNREGSIAGHRLIVSNRTAGDIILRDEFEAMQGLEVTWVLTDGPRTDGPNIVHGRIDEDFLKHRVHDISQHFYVCGPDQMVKDLRDALEGLGAATDALVWEK